MVTGAANSDYEYPLHALAFCQWKLGGGELTWYIPNDELNNAMVNISNMKGVSIRLW